MNLPDSGPIYAETILDRFPVEPWNTYSNLIFLFTFLWFSYRTGFNWRQYPLITVTLPLLFIGFVGGTIFHATRSDRLWLRMDYIPIFLSCLCAAFYFWKQYSSSFLLAFCGLAIPFALIRLLWIMGSISLVPKIAISYSLLAASLILPALLFARSKNWLGIRYLILAIFSFIAAISFRSLDLKLVDILPMGSHFLWHVFGGVSAFLMLRFAEEHERPEDLKLNS